MGRQGVCGCCIPCDALRTLCPHPHTLNQTNTDPGIPAPFRPAWHLRNDPHRQTVRFTVAFTAAVGPRGGRRSVTPAQQVVTLVTLWRLGSLRTSRVCAKSLARFRKIYMKSGYGLHVSGTTSAAPQDGAGGCMGGVTGRLKAGLSTSSRCSTVKNRPRSSHEKPTSGQLLCSITTRGCAARAVPTPHGGRGRLSAHHTCVKGKKREEHGRRRGGDPEHQRPIPCSSLRYTRFTFRTH